MLTKGYVLITTPTNDWARDEYEAASASWLDRLRALAFTATAEDKCWRFV